MLVVRRPVVRPVVRRATLRRRVYLARPTRKYARRPNTGPAFKSGKAAGITVVHREYIGEVTTGAVVGGASQYTAKVYPLQVGEPETFPWLSNLANNFEQYNIKRMKFEFISTCADGTAAGVNNSLGSVMGAVEYNVYGAAPQNKQQLENMYMARSTKPSQSMTFYVDCQRKHAVLKDLYIRGGSVPPTGQDQRMYDYGYFVLATQGMQAQNVIGELWVSYEVEMMKPQMLGIGTSGVAAFTNVSYTWQQAAAASLYFGYWFDNNIVAAAASGRQAGFNIYSPPGVFADYPTSTIPLAPASTLASMYSGLPSLTPPNTSTTNVVESSGAVSPLLLVAGVNHGVQWADQHGVLIESVPPLSTVGTSTAPTPALSGGLVLYFPPSMQGCFRITLNAILTNATLSATAIGGIQFNASRGVRGLNTFPLFNGATDTVANVPATAPLASRKSSLIYTRSTRLGNVYPVSCGTRFCATTFSKKQGVS